jgi:hypothetical protein
MPDPKPENVSPELRAWPCSRPMLLLAAVGLALASCDSPTDPGANVYFTSSSVTLDAWMEGLVTLVNDREEPVAGLRFDVDPVENEGGARVPGVEIATLAGWSTLPPGLQMEIGIRAHVGPGLQPGTYRTTVTARSDGVALASVEVLFELEASSPPAEVVAVEILPPTEPVVQGDVTELRARGLTLDGSPVPDLDFRWEIDPPDAGYFGEGGRFVPYREGSWTVTAHSGGYADSAVVQVQPRQRPVGEFEVVGRGWVDDRFTSDLWVWGDVAYTGTWGTRTTDAGSLPGNTLHVWDISDPTDPARVHSLQVDAGRVNDVKMREDGTLAALTHEASSDGANGITLLDLSDPFHPEPIVRFTDQMSPGVHNVWLEGDHVYVVVNGQGNGLRIVDVSDPASPTIVSSFYASSSILHDVYVRDGLAFLSHWDAGLVILDVGHGIEGGSPENPREVGRVRTAWGSVHNAWYWPETGYVFVGEENFERPGIMHVVDARDLRDPVQVATFRVPDQTPHNFWLDEDRGILYMAWYGQGVRALDVRGELLGELERQDREIAGLPYDGVSTTQRCDQEAGVRTCTWSPHLHRGLVFLSDKNSGLVVVDPRF